MIYIHSFYNTRISNTCSVHSISLSHLSHVNLAAESRIKYLVEIVGTFILVYAVCTAATVYHGPNIVEGIAGLDKLSTIGVGLVAAFV